MPNIIKDKSGTHPQVFKRIDPSNTKITAIQVNKRFQLTSGSEINSGNPDDSAPDFKALYANYVPTLPEINPFSGDAYFFNTPETTDFRRSIDGIYAFNVYYSINRLFYKYKNDARQQFGIMVPPDKGTKILYQSASVFSIPQRKMGLKVKPGSFIFSGSNIGNTIDIKLQSDKYENIIESNVDTSDFVTGEKFYEGFNEYFDISRLDLTVQNGKIGTTTPFPNQYQETSVTESLTFVPGVTTSVISRNIGQCAFFSGSAFLKTKIDGLYDRDHDYAISFYICSGSNLNIFDDNIISKTPNHFEQQYPFRIYYSQGKIKFSISAGTNLYFEVTSSNTLDPTAWNHVICQKTGSTMELYLNGVLDNHLQSDSLLPTDEILTFATASGNISNKYAIKIGGFAKNNRNLRGQLDEIRIYNKALNSTDISSLTNRDDSPNILQTNIVGNSFDNNGFFIISSPDPKYNQILESKYTASYQSTINIFEFSTLCRIDQGDFNMTVNHSALKDDNETYMSHVTSSAFEPYITTVGLYNKHAELLAVGKLANPLKNRNDVDINILVRCDLDQDRYARIVDDNEFD